MASLPAPEQIRRDNAKPVSASYPFQDPEAIRTNLGVPGGQPWTFQQLGGAKKSITLSGWAAPFGRPRREPVVTPAIEVRDYERRYPGNDLPTRHVFGVKWDNVELHGRWMDSWGGRGFAKAQLEEFVSFINDTQPCRITWGDTLSITGLVKRLEPAIESPAQIAWKLTIEVDSNASLKPTVGPVPTPKSPGGLLNQLLESMSDETASALTTPSIIKPSFFDALDTLLQFVNAPAAVLLSIAADVASFKDATFAELARFRGVLQQYRQALQSFRNTYEQAKVQLAIEFARSDEELALYRQQAIFGASMAEALRQIVEADRAANNAQRRLIKAFVTAKFGDTWESISRRGYDGSSDRAQDIREMNDVPAGQGPTPGGVYILPI